MKKVKVIKDICIGYGEARRLNDVFEVDEFHFNDFIKQGIVEEVKEVVEVKKPSRRRK